MPCGTCEWRTRRAAGTYLGPRDAERGAEGDPERGEPREGEACARGEERDGRGDGGAPERGDGAGDEGRGDEAENDGEHEEPRPEGLHDPARAASVRALRGLGRAGRTSGAARWGGWWRRPTMRG